VTRHRVELTEAAERDIAEAEEWIAADSHAAAERWIDGLLAGFESLETMPARCPLAPENTDHAEEIRQLIYQSHRVLFTIAERRVVILHVRHGARLPFGPE
jgi:plasmid stabilization system protein ParE